MPIVTKPVPDKPRGCPQQLQRFRGHQRLPRLPPLGKWRLATSRTVFLTGASSGIGLETAKLLTAQGFEVWGTSRDPARLPKLPRFHGVPMDLTQMDSIRRGFAAASQEAGAFDVLINNAGAGVFGAIDAVPAEMVREQFQVWWTRPWS